MFLFENPFTVASVVDPGCLSRIDFSIPDPGQNDSGSQIRIKEFKYFLPQKIFSKLSEI
jgi:hypothetical protein